LLGSITRSAIWSTRLFCPTPVRALVDSAAPGCIQRRVIRWVDRNDLGVATLGMNPVWSPDGKFIVYSEKGGGPWCLLKAITPERQPFPLPEVRIVFRGNRYRFLPGGKALVLMQGYWKDDPNFWLLDLVTGSLRRLTDLDTGFLMKSFDVSPDGKQILFDRFRENSDVVLIDLPPR